MSIDVADITARLGLESAAFDAAMTAAEGHARDGATRMRLALAGITVGAVVGLGAMVKAASDFQGVTQTLANNTNMGAAGLAQMRQISLQIAQQTGQPLEDIANGYMHIANHAYEGAAAMNIAMAAAKNAAATGGVASDDMNVLAGVMREYGVSAQQAAQDTQLATRYLDVLHNAVANSNYTMQQFAEGAKMAFATAGSYKVPLSQVSAELAILSEHGFPGVQRASTNWAGMLGALERPTAKALQGMKQLSAATGVSLLGDITKLRADGAFLPQFLADIAKATQGDPNKIAMVMTQTNTYGRALRALVLNQAELARVTKLTTAAQAGQRIPGLTGTNEAFANWQKTTQGQLLILKGTFESLSVELGSVFLPMLNNALTAIVPVVQRFTTWVGQQHDLGGALASAVSALQAIFPRLLTWMTGTALPTLERQLGAWGQAFAAWVGPMIPVVLGDLGRLKDQLVSWLVQQVPVWTTQLAAWAGAFTGWIVPQIPVVLGYLGTLKDQMVSWIGQQLPVWGAQMAAWGQQFVAWVVPHIQPLLDQLGRLKDRVVTWIVTAAPTLGPALGKWTDQFGSVATRAWTAMQPTLRTLGNNLVAWMQNTAKDITQNTGKWAQEFADWIVPVNAGVPTTMGTFTDALDTWAQGPGAQAMVNLANAMAGVFLAALGDMLKNGIKNAFLAGWNSTNSAPIVGGLSNFEASLLGTFGQGIGSHFGGTQPVRPHTKLDVSGVPATAARGGIGGGPTTIHVHVSPNGTTVSGAQTAAHQRMGQQLGDAVKAVMDHLSDAERRVVPPPPRHVPGARAS